MKINSTKQYCMRKMSGFNAQTNSLKCSFHMNSSIPSTEPCIIYCSAILLNTCMTLLHILTKKYFVDKQISLTHMPMGTSKILGIHIHNHPSHFYASRYTQYESFPNHFSLLILIYLPSAQCQSSNIHIQTSAAEWLTHTHTLVVHVHIFGRNKTSCSMMTHVS